MNEKERAMQIFDTLKKTEYSTSVALGFFDGVHLGHQDVIKTAVQSAGENCKSAVLTFKESPSATLGKEKKPMLNTNGEKLKLFESLGVDAVYCIDFEEIRHLSAEDFVKKVLCDTLNAEFVSVGFNYHFGKGGTATADDLTLMCEELSIRSQKRMPVKYNNEAISSTRIRECIANGEIENANTMLGYDFAINVTVKSGNHIGSKISSPTINQPLSNALVIPRFGVYASVVTIGEQSYMGATNIGVHPTVGKTNPVCETHLLDFSGGDLYGEKVATKLLHFIRPEQKFESLDELKKQIEKDKAEILKYLKK